MKRAPIYVPTCTAAARLGISEDALRNRCRRARTGDGETIYLGNAVRAVKLGTSWRFQFPEDQGHR